MSISTNVQSELLVVAPASGARIVHVAEPDADVDRRVVEHDPEAGCAAAMARSQLIGAHVEANGDIVTRGFDGDLAGWSLRAPEASDRGMRSRRALSSRHDEGTYRQAADPLDAAGHLEHGDSPVLVRCRPAALGGRDWIIVCQQALIDLAKQAERTGINEAEADTLLEWAEEYGVPPRANDMRTDHWVSGGDIGIGPVNHMPVPVQ